MADENPVTNSPKASASPAPAPAAPRAAKSDAEKLIEEGRKRQAEAVARQEAIEAASPPTPTQEESDRARLGLPVDLAPSGLPVDSSVHPIDAFRDASVGEPSGNYKTRDSNAK